MSKGGPGKESLAGHVANRIDGLLKTGFNVLAGTSGYKDETNQENR